MSKGKKILLGLFGLLLLLAGGLYLVPMGRYLPEVEAQLSKQLHVPAKITALSLAAFPLPHLEVHGIEIGGTGGITVQTVSVTPDFFSLLSAAVQISEVKLSQVNVNYPVLQKIIAAQQANPSKEKSKVVLRVLRAEAVTFNLPGLSVPDLALKVSFRGDGVLEEIWAAQDKEHLTVTLRPQEQQQFTLQLAAKDWTLPLGEKWKLDEASMSGTLSAHELMAKSFQARMGDSQLAGSLNLGFGRIWKLSGEVSQLALSLEQLGKLREQPLEMKGVVNVKGPFSANAASPAALKDNLRFTGELEGKGMQLRLAQDATQLLQLDSLRAQLLLQGSQLTVQGLDGVLYNGKLQGQIGLGLLDKKMQAELNVAGLDMQPLVAALTNRVLFSGSLDGQAKLQVALAEMATFPQQASINGSFVMQKGALSKVNLVEAAQIGGDKKADGKTASTEFDEFSGMAQVDAAGYHFRNLRLTSGVLRAQGQVDLGVDKRLKGDLDADLKGTLGIVSVPLVVSGTLDEPSVAPSAGFVAGAALGTAVLPGVGTVVGMKIGGFLNRVFNGGGSQSAVPAR